MDGGMIRNYIIMESLVQECVLVVCIVKLECRCNAADSKVYFFAAVVKVPGRLSAHYRCRMHSLCMPLTAHRVPPQHSAVPAQQTDPRAHSGHATAQANACKLRAVQAHHTLPWSFAHLADLPVAALLQHNLKAASAQLHVTEVWVGHRTYALSVLINAHEQRGSVRNCSRHARQVTPPMMPAAQACSRALA
jgi:hypothetical protein